MSAFAAIRVDRTGDAAYVEMEEDALMAGDVDLDVTHSAINYKDGLAVTGQGPVVRRFPMIPGVDLAGIVTRSDNPDFTPGDAVVATGCGLGESHYGGFAQRARVKSEWLIRLPTQFTPARAMTIGTAGLTAALCILALERHGLKPHDGLAAVTGASGGVGSFATALLAKAGWRVGAVTGRTEEAPWLERLGAAEIFPRDEFAAPGKALQTQRFAAGIDTVGGVTLANLLAQTQWDGAVAACGNVGGMALPTSVAPFILRGVSLIGVESVRPRLELRCAAWSRIAADLDPAMIDGMSEIIPFDRALERAKSIVSGKIRGRVVIDMAR